MTSANDDYLAFSLLVDRFDGLLKAIPLQEVVAHNDIVLPSFQEWKPLVEEVWVD